MAQRVEKVNLQKRKIASSPKKGSKGLCITFQCQSQKLLEEMKFSTKLIKKRENNSINLASLLHHNRSLATIVFC